MCWLWVTPSIAQVTAFKQAVAEAASTDSDIAAFYRSNDFEPLWTGKSSEHQTRRVELIRALSAADIHGLSPARYNVAALLQQMEAARTTRDLGLVEIELSKTFLQYARDVQSGTLVPSRIDSGLVRQVPYRDRTAHMTNFARSSPREFLKALPPQSAQYRALMKEKLRLEGVMENGGWGPTVSAGSLKPGQGGAPVVALRNRLIAMGYMSRSASQSYDTQIEKAVRLFQQAHGLTADGVAGKGTMSEINVSVQQRLKSVIVAMERERWINMELGPRHVLVNQTDFTAKIVDNGKVTFQTRSVIGKNTSDRRSPEFSDEMEFMVVNPSWYVPRSIVTKEYLPKLRNNPNAVGHIEITDSRGRRVNRANANFSQYTARNFPYAMRQPPSSRNALGLVKFMFPNRYNIYLHDTPSKSLFDREVRAFSHGCIRLADPFDFAYALLARQSDDPKGKFQRILKSGRETKVMLDMPVPVHIIYRTAVIDPKGKAEYRRDVYGRDAKIWKALENAGVTLGAVQG
ncbi:L,D-transpeptidase family protein [Sedimentitalea todarodis]|uniref:L,D-transpeptidase family protein n=1 Tax=Sedimentitalea todarodis TaxID=1631240 RepID=A0ABU3VAV1_9RHOB|nr:L,D-transpeptidase family protein [Sedimentitalea todarodis]MDU9003287.1 L,D-transpeptidase family protein [Sedimentitalea todarodis]